MRIGPFDLRLSGKDKPDKGAEIGATGSSVFAGLLYEDEYNSDLQGDKAIKVYDRMRRSDGQVKAGLLACKLPLMVARWDIQPASEDAIDVKIADTVKADLLDSLVWDDFLRQALIMLDFGHMLFEKVWELRDGRYTWRKLAPRLPQSIVEWHLTDDGELDHVVQQASKGNAFIRPSIPAGKLIVFTHEKEGSNFRGISMLRAAYKHWYYKNNLYAIDGMAAERHGIGLASFTYPDQATEAQKAAIKEIGERLHAHERAYVAHPDSIGFDLKGVQGQLHDIKGSIDHHDLQIVRSILAQFMNLGGKSSGGSYALSQDQSQFFLMALQSVAKNICNTVNRDGIKEMVDYNWDVKRYPRLTVSGLDSPDVLSYAQAVATLVTAGAITADIETENELRRMVKMPFKKGARPVELIGESTAKQPIPSIESGADGQAAENIVEGAKLNGIQITASLTVLTDLIAGGIPPEVALELLVAVGIDRDKAQKMVDSCKDFKSSQVAGPATPKPMPEADAAKASEEKLAYSPDQSRTEEGKFEDMGKGHETGRRDARGGGAGGVTGAPGVKWAELEDKDRFEISKNVASKLDSKEFKAVSGWSVDDYHNIRAAQKSGESTPAFTSALNKMPAYEGTVYRGGYVSSNVNESFTVGSDLKLRADSSSSVDNDVAMDYSLQTTKHENTPIVYELKTKTGADIRPVSRVAGEEEIVLRKGSSYVITAVERRHSDLYARDYYVVKGSER